MGKGWNKSYEALGPFLSVNQSVFGVFFMKWKYAKVQVYFSVRYIRFRLTEACAEYTDFQEAI